MEATTKNEQKETPPTPPPNPKGEQKFVRPKRKYTKKKDRLMGIVVSNEPVVVRFD
jgi:hypothetical protein